MALGIWGAVGGLGFALGPLIGGFFTDEFSWRWVWWSNIPAAVLLLAMAVWFLGGLPGGRKGVRVDMGGLALLVVGLVAAALVLQQGASWGWTSVAVLGLAGLAVATLGWFVTHELRTADPLVHLRLLRNPMFTAGNVGTFANAVGLIGILYFFNVFVQSVVLLDWSALAASLALLPYGLSVFAGRLADRVGARGPVARRAGPDGRRLVPLRPGRRRHHLFGALVAVGGRRTGRGRDVLDALGRRAEGRPTRSSGRGVRSHQRLALHRRGAGGRDRDARL